MDSAELLLIDVNAPSGNPSPAGAAAFYDRVWSDWGHLDERSPASLHRRREIIRLVRNHARSSRRILEVGCGQGSLLQRLTNEFPAALVHGADVSEESLARARARCPRATVFRLDLDSPYFDEQAAPWLGSFDLIVSSEVLEHLNNDRRALERLSRLLTPNGKLIVSVPAGERTRFDHAIGHLRHYTEPLLAEKLSEAGFDVERMFAWGFPFHSLYRWTVKWAARATMRTDGSPRQPNTTRPKGFLSTAYVLFSTGLTPLYLLNSSRCGPQLFAIARKI